VSLLAAVFSFAMISQTPDIEDVTGNEAFDFYFGEFILHELEGRHGMRRIIEEGLAKAVFSTNDSDQFYRFLHVLKEAMLEHPERLKSFQRLDRLMGLEFEIRMKKAKRMRWLYTAGGALAGALIAIPVGKVLSNTTKLGRAALVIAIPSGILAGGGAGFLLGHLLAVPHYQYEAGDLSEDIGFHLDELEALND
jgi:hypothetical protein